jgi:hypothetical protein
MFHPAFHAKVDAWKLGPNAFFEIQGISSYHFIVLHESEEYE